MDYYLRMNRKFWVESIYLEGLTLDETNKSVNRWKRSEEGVGRQNRNSSVVRTTHHDTQKTQSGSVYDGSCTGGPFTLR